MPAVEIHTSDRGLYKRCRRRFGWSSTLRENLVRVGPDHSAFFLGTGFHFALEDWWGYRRFSHPSLAFAAYYDAQKNEDLPDDSEDILELAHGMLSYYVEDWLVDYPEPYVTLVVDGRPQVEVEVSVDITGLLLDSVEDKGWLRDVIAQHNDADRVLYVTTYDRAVIDDDEVIFGMDYKTAKTFDEFNLVTNPQAGSYDWSASLFYTPLGYRWGGMIWQQHKKAVPVEPKRVYVGQAREAFSMAGDQSTTYRLYRRAVKRHYGKVPAKYNEILSYLLGQRDDYGDPFVRREVLRRNQYQREVEQGKIVDEVLEMLDPDLPLYPNPTKECGWDCPFKEPCLAMDDGSDYEYLLKINYARWLGYKDDWRKRVKYPDAESQTTTEQHTITF